MKQRRITNHQISSCISRLEPFQANSTEADWLYPTNCGHGRLPHIWSQQLRGLDKEDMVYIVYSYSTPIAWNHRGQWTVPDVKYSQTTSCAQGRVRYGIQMQSPLARV